MRSVPQPLVFCVPLCLLVGCAGDAITPNAEPTAVASKKDSPVWPEIDDRPLEAMAETLGYSLGAPTGVQISPTGDLALFRRSGPRSFESDLYQFDIATGETAILLRASDLLGGAEESLSVEEKARRERMRVATRGITSYRWSEDGKKILVPLSGKLYVYDLETKAVRDIATPAGYPIDPRLSPDGDSIAYVIDGDLYVQPLGGAARRLTRKRSPAVTFGTSEFVAQEEMGRHAGFWFSPDSKLIAYQRTDSSAVEELSVADATHPEKPANRFRYPRVGTPNAEVTLAIAPVSDGKAVSVAWDRTRYPYLASVRWSDSAPLTVLVQNRTQTEAALLTVDSKSGKTRTLLTEVDDAWLNLDQSVPAWLPDGSGFLWSSEREGFWRLELRDRSGELVRMLTDASLGYRSVIGIDESAGQVWLSAAADPRYRDVYRVPLAGGDVEKLSEGPGVHSAVLSKESGVAAVYSSLSNGARSAQIRRVDGTWAGTLPSVAEEPARLPAPELVTVEVEGRRHHAAIVRPRSFDPARKYPVIASVYAGPHVTVVSSTPQSYLMNQWYADAGFIVVRMDGRGTPGRGRDWERVIKGDLMSTALSDQVAIIEALCAEHPELDCDRIGVTGWSFGGYFSAMAILLRPDVFKAGVAGAPVTDWRDYDTHYTERYMGLLEDNAEGYDRTSAMTYADRLHRPLMLIHGTTDDNVYFTHSLKLSQALFRAGKTFEFLPLAGFTHMVPDPRVKVALHRRVVEFFRQHLGPARSP